MQAIRYYLHAPHAICIYVSLLDWRTILLLDNSFFGLHANFQHGHANASLYSRFASFSKCLAKCKTMHVRPVLQHRVSANFEIW